MSDYLLRGESRAKAWSGYWWPMREARENINIYDDGGPLQKYDQFCVKSGMTNPRSQEFEKWQNWSDARMDAATGQTSSWWGHCNGWAAAAALEPEPVKAVTISGSRYSVGDQKGLLTVCHNADPVDLIHSLGSSEAHLFHALLVQSIGKDGRVLIFDTKLDPKDPQTGQSVREVWNYPAYRYECSYNQRDGQTWDVTTKVWFSTDFVEPDFVGVKNWPVDGQPKVYTYRLSGDREHPTAGTWTGASVNDHPDIVWRPQPLEVQNAAEEHSPGGSQSRFHPVRRNVVYSLIGGKLHTPSAADRSADAGLHLSWVVTDEERASYPPPIERGDFWRYSVAHIDSSGRWSRPFRIQLEVVGWVGDHQQDWVVEVSTLQGGEQPHVRHVVYLDAKTRTLSGRAPYNQGYAYSLHRDPVGGGFTRSESPALWENSPLRLLLSQTPYAWERAGHEPVSEKRFAALSEQPLRIRKLRVGKGEQLWADHTVSSPRGNLRGMFLLSSLDKIQAELYDFGKNQND